jgi:membrane-bound ClpP family serine protease
MSGKPIESVNQKIKKNLIMWLTQTTTGGLTVTCGAKGIVLEFAVAFGKIHKISGG